ncbi:hypothetical protein [Nonomuraea solani]|uniref:hypothetical protein n=1 Tax=Nonomuraea solani TaxID=1144553 RepID=UPI000CDED987|nr:hypothetical protein [Nonomuraea solani]
MDAQNSAMTTAQLSWWLVPHQPGWPVAGTRSSTSSAGGSSGRNGTGTSSSIVLTLTPGVVSTARHRADGW